ncbi:MAG: hypothetical protein ACKVQS_12925 [Fimbriimonadaceae bacterium]
MISTLIAIMALGSQQTFNPPEFTVPKDPSPVKTDGSVEQTTSKGKFVHRSSVECTFHLVDTGELSDGEYGQMPPNMTCLYLCKGVGGGHTSHDTCIGECDDPCLKGDHELEVHYKARPISNKLDAISGKLCAQTEPKVTQGYGFVSATSKALAKARDQVIAELDARSRVATSPHFAKACESAMRSFKFRVFNIVCHAKIKTMPGSDIYPPQEYEAEDTIATVLIPDFTKNSFSKSLTCICRPPAEPRTPPVVEGSDPLAWTPQRPTNGTSGETFNVNISGIDLNVAGATASSPATEPQVINVPPGVILQSSDSKVQNLVIVVFAVIVSSKSDIYAALNPSSFLPLVDPVNVRVACIEMHKKEPHPGVKYNVTSKIDPTLQRLCLLTNFSRNRGSKDQARIWIYTDKATFEEINEVLNPGVTGGQYMSDMLDVEKCSSIDFERSDYKKCLTPGPLTSPFTDTETLEWYIQLLEKVDQKGLTMFLQTKGSELANEISQRGEVAFPYVANLIDAFYNVANDATLTKLPTFLNAALPAASKEQILSKSKAYQKFLKDKEELHQKRSATTTNKL